MYPWTEFMNRIILKEYYLKQLCKIPEFSTISNLLYYDIDLNIYQLKFKLLCKSTANASLECIDVQHLKNSFLINKTTIKNSKQYKDSNWLDINVVVDC